MDARPFKLRRAGAADAAAFGAQRVALFRELRTLAPEDSARFEAATHAAFGSALGRGTCLAWLALAADGVVVGSCALSLAERLPSPANPSPVEGWLAHVFVVPAWRRAGVGSALVRAALAEAGARALGRVRLHATEPGRALYERLGFRLRANDMERAVGREA